MSHSASQVRRERDGQTDERRKTGRLPTHSMNISLNISPRQTRSQIKHTQFFFFFSKKKDISSWLFGQRPISQSTVINNSCVTNVIIHLNQPTVSPPGYNLLFKMITTIDNEANSNGNESWWTLTEPFSSFGHRSSFFFFFLLTSTQSLWEFAYHQALVTTLKKKKGEELDGRPTRKQHLVGPCNGQLDYHPSK